MQQRPIIYFLLGLTLCFSQVASFAQDRHKIDSLKQVLRSAQTDRVRTKACLKLCNEFSNMNLDSCRYYCDKTIEFAKKANINIEIAAAYNNLGKSYSFFGSNEKALEYFLLSIKESEKDSTGPGMMVCAVNYLDIASRYDGLSDAKTALDFRRKGWALFQKVRDDLRLINEVKDFDKEISGPKFWKQISAAVYNDFGNSFASLFNTDSALYYYEASAKLFDEIGMHEAKLSPLLSAGHIYSGKKEFEKALRNYTTVLDYGRRNMDRDYVSVPLMNIARIYLEQKRYNAAIESLTEALEYLRTTEHASSDEKYYCYLQLANAYKASRNFEGAARYYDSSIVLKDSIDWGENRKNMNEMKVKFETSEKEKQIILLEQQNKLNELKGEKQKLTRNILIGGFVVVLIFASVIFRGYRQKLNDNVIISRQKAEVEQQKERSDELLLNILPSEVAEELKVKGSADAKQFDEVTVMFTDFKNFTRISEKLSPSELVAEIHTCFKAFDNIIGRYNVEKIKTIGDSYMCAGGLPVSNTTNATDVVKAALEIQQFMQQHLRQRISESKEVFEIRIGIHTGPVVAGIVGVKKFAYDIWGDTVNIASRMESSGEAGKINISGSTYELVKDKFNCVYRGKIPAKNKGEIDMYFAESVG